METRVGGMIMYFLIAFNFLLGIMLWGGCICLAISGSVWWAILYGIVGWSISVGVFLILMKIARQEIHGENK